MRRSIITAMAAVLMAAFITPATAEKVGVSIYTGWMPWYYMKDTGIMERWAKKYGVEVEIKHAAYVPSIEAFVAGDNDACLMTTYDALMMPVSGGVDCTVLIVGDYGNGSDKVLTRGLSVADFGGHKAYLVEGSISSYVLFRAMQIYGLEEGSVKASNVNEDDLGPTFIRNLSMRIMVSWNPIVMRVMQAPGIINAFDSSQIPGEILDVLVVKTNVLRRNPDFGKALAGAWYEVMGIMTSRGPARKSALEQMANAGENTLTEFESQLSTVAMFWKPGDAAAYAASDEIKEKTDLLRRYCATHPLPGIDVTDPDAIGIQYPDGTVQGDPKNIKLRFSTEYMQMAADGKL